MCKHRASFHAGHLGQGGWQDNGNSHHSRDDSDEGGTRGPQEQWEMEQVRGLGRQRRIRQKLSPPDSPFSKEDEACMCHTEPL